MTEPLQEISALSGILALALFLILRELILHRQDKAERLADAEQRKTDAQGER